MHYSASTTYHHGMQMAMGAGNPSHTYLRGWWANGGSGYGWQRIWTSGNDGSGSGLDADYVDGIEASSFLRSDANDTATGALTINTVKIGVMEMTDISIAIQMEEQLLQVVIFIFKAV